VWYPQQPKMMPKMATYKDWIGWLCSLGGEHG
jgi:hypothetical protein